MQAGEGEQRIATIQHVILHLGHSAQVVHGIPQTALLLELSRIADQLDQIAFGEQDHSLESVELV